MTIIQKIAVFSRKKLNFNSLINFKTLVTQKFNPFILISFLIVFSVLFFVTSNLIQKNNNRDANRLKEIAENKEFTNLTNFLLSKINSPYEEVVYVIKNNDTIEKILKEFKIKKYTLLLHLTLSICNRL